MESKNYRTLSGSAIVIVILLCLSTGSWALEYTEKELEAISEFRELMKNDLYEEYMKSNDYLITWLRSRNMNVHAAREMLLQSLAWRKQNQIDSILEEDFSPMPGQYKVNVKGQDKDGRPLFFIYFGQWDIRKAVISGQHQMLQRYLVSKLEYAAKLIRSVNASSEHHNITQLDIIFEGTGYNLRQHGCLACLPQYAYFISNLETHYPYLPYKIFIVNAPSIFQPLLQFMMPLFTQATRDALSVHGVDKNQWLPMLLDLIPADQLPQRLGGTA